MANDPELERFIKESYMHQGRMEASMINMEKYIGAVSENCKTNTKAIHDKIDRHVDGHTRALSIELDGQKHEIISERRAGVATWLQVFSILLPTAISIIAIYVSTRGGRQ